MLVFFNKRSKFNGKREDFPVLFCPRMFQELFRLLFNRNTLDTFAFNNSKNFLLRLMPVSAYAEQRHQPLLFHISQGLVCLALITTKRRDVFKKQTDGAWHLEKKEQTIKGPFPGGWVSYCPSHFTTCLHTKGGRSEDVGRVDASWKKRKLVKFDLCCSFCFDLRGSAFCTLLVKNFFLNEIFFF